MIKVSIASLLTSSPRRSNQAVQISRFNKTIINVISHSNYTHKCKRTVTGENLELARLDYNLQAVANEHQEDKDTTRILLYETTSCESNWDLAYR